MNQTTVPDAVTLPQSGVMLGAEPMRAVDAAQLNALVLAYVGDAVQDLAVRTYLATHRKANAHALHIEAVGQVRASAQAGMLHRILDRLTEQEQAIYRRGRNAKSATVPKNADMAEYRVATGLEAVLGYLYLSGQTERLHTVLGWMLETI